ncbi:MAG: FAD-binding oxidoreductase, partial [Bacteroidia bacterium]|nr:FAD-binding oxidoreductase [Bacteroidia bacterium]
CVYHAHVGSGELHLRPLLNLKDPADIEQFKMIARETVPIVKKYRGSLSGEHGDGRLRAALIPLLLGDHNYALINRIKNIFDPGSLFNPGKITEAPPMDQFLRNEPGVPTPEISTYQDFSTTLGVVRAAEKCNGSGDCRKSPQAGGAMCPSYQASHGISFRTRLIAYLPVLYRLAQPFSRLVNAFMQTAPFLGAFKRIAGFHAGRSMPPLAKQSLNNWISGNLLTINPSEKHQKGFVYLFADEFTNYQDSSIGIKAIKLLTRLGYQVKIARKTQSGRTFISKGLLRKARSIARENVNLYYNLVNEEHPLIGIEPSAILGFRDEFPDLVGDDLRQQAFQVGNHSLLIEEFLEREMKTGNISEDSFTREYRKIFLHGHCQQKAVASTASTLYVLNFPKNFECSEIPSGCCGMAGAFGFEKEHFELSMKVGELVLFPAVREADENVLICASGTSCRHQILDGTGRKAVHPVEILYDAMLSAIMVFP